MRNLSLLQIIWIIGILLIPFMSLLIYWFKNNFKLNEINIWIATFIRKEKLLPITNENLGETFNRYFATVLSRPFYILPDQQKILEDANRILVENANFLVLVLDGTGGVGKTAIAAEIIRHTKELGFIKPLGDGAKKQVYQDGEIQEIDDLAVLEWGELLNTLLIQLGSPSLIHYSVREREKWIRKQINLEKYLILVDNLESIENAKNVTALLRDLISGSKSRGLITYRYQDLGEIRGVYRLNVTGLGKSSSLTFLQNELENRGYKGLREWIGDSEEDREILLKIVEIVQGLPLALQLVIGLRISIPLTTIYKLLCDVSLDSRVESLYEFLYRKELELLPKESLKLLTIAFSKQSGYYLDELKNILQISTDEINILISNLRKFSLVYKTSRLSPKFGMSDYYHIHPMLFQLLGKIRYASK